MEEKQCMERYNPEEAQFGLHPPVDGCFAECESCPNTIKRNSTMRRLQLDLGFVCDLGCYKCDRHLDVVPGKKEENLTLEQLERMLAESAGENYKWEAMLLLGGEPTLHPQFREIVSLICKYRKEYNPELRIRMASNGYSKKAKTEIEWLDKRHPEILVVDTKKLSKIQEDFVNVRTAPKDIFPDRSTYKRCEIPCYSGLGFNYSGFYGCATGGGTARIFGMDIGIKSIRELTYDNIEKFFKTVCPLCGHGEADFLLQHPEITDTISWKDAIRNYKENGVEILTRY